MAYIEHSNHAPFLWSASADSILGKSRLVVTGLTNHHTGASFSKSMISSHITRRRAMKTIATSAFVSGIEPLSAKSPKPALHAYPDYGRLRVGLDFLTEKPMLRASWENI